MYDISRGNQLSPDHLQFSINILRKDVFDSTLAACTLLCNFKSSAVLAKVCTLTSSRLCFALQHSSNNSAAKCLVLTAIQRSVI